MFCEFFINTVTDVNFKFTLALCLFHVYTKWHIRHFLCRYLNNHHLNFKTGGSIMTYTYMTKGTCSTKIELELEGNVVHNVKFTGGCNGNLQAIPKLVEGLTVEQVEEKISGISCNGRGTSCGDQLAKACREAYEASKD
jgi:uncharacterized protein (TIGR03905 family)